MSGSDVRQLQKVLTELNFPTRVDGKFGKGTKRSVNRYERWKEDRLNGVVHKPQARRMKQLMRAGVRYRKHVFPVRGPHDYGSAGSRFGAPREARAHQGQDMSAAEGTRLVAVHEGRVTTRQYEDGGAGHYLVIRGKDGSDSVYMHMMRRPIVAVGEKVMAGQLIGRVGSTGASSGPHLHFELWTPHWYDGGAAYDPLPKLKKWDRRT
ncbi:MAG: peptidoglycan DD-metalloendopeptidase family protein [Thermoleophilaceae bacterium]|nr:peptidoglycan DD-metalloendopeptidase family protein [Thermoleophilaceae bacterium]